MGSPERTIIEQLKTTLAEISTGDGYNYSLDGADQVHVGGTFLPDRLPSLYIFADETQSQIVQGRTALNSFTRTQLVTIEMWIGTNSTDPGEVHLAPLDAQHDIMRKLELDRSINGLVDDIIMNCDRIYAVKDLPGVTVARVNLTLRYREVAGT